MSLQRSATADGAILYDPAFVDDPRMLFDLEGWRSRGGLREESRGRGSIVYLEDGARHYVLRRYLRGGLPAKLLHEGFLWVGENSVRSFREALLLRRLLDLGLPVPVPVAARYVRQGFCYRAQLVTLRLAASEPLADRLLAGRVDGDTWAVVGRTIRRFHDAGVHHADLNAANIMLGAEGRTWLLDFDRGRLRRAGRWQDQSLARLERSLAKICRRQTDDRWRDGFSRLLAAYRDGTAAAGT